MSNKFMNIIVEIRCFKLKAKKLFKFFINNLNFFKIINKYLYIYS